MTTTDATIARARVRRLIVRDLLAAVLRYCAIMATSFALMILAKLCAVAIPLALKHIVDDLGHRASPAVFPVFLVLAYALLRFFADGLNEARDVVFSPVTQRTVAAFAERTSVTCSDSARAFMPSVKRVQSCATCKRARKELAFYSSPRCFRCFPPSSRSVRSSRS
jgi:hypothetical protein